MLHIYLKRVRPREFNNLLVFGWEGKGGGKGEAQTQWLQISLTKLWGRKGSMPVWIVWF